MSRRETIQALIARVEAGETGRGLDVEVHLLIEPSLADWPWQYDARFAGWVDTSDPDRLNRIDAPRYVVSIDAQAALPLKIIKMDWWEITDIDGRRDECEVIGKKPTSRTKYIGRAPTEPASRLAAHLRAMMETINDLP